MHTKLLSVQFFEKVPGSCAEPASSFRRWFHFRRSAASGKAPCVDLGSLHACICMIKRTCACKKHAGDLRLRVHGRPAEVRQRCCTWCVPRLGLGVHPVTRPSGPRHLLVRACMQRRVRACARTLALARSHARMRARFLVHKALACPHARMPVRLLTPAGSHAACSSTRMPCRSRT